MRALRCILRHDWQDNCVCRRCGARNPAVDHVLDEACRCVMCGQTFHLFDPSGDVHRCRRCGINQPHVGTYVNNRWVGIGAWDSDLGNYDVERADEVCALCGVTLEKDVETGMRRH